MNLYMSRGNIPTRNPEKKFFRREAIFSEK